MEEQMFRRADAVAVILDREKPEFHVLEAKSPKDPTVYKLPHQLHFFSKYFDYAWAVLHEENLDEGVRYVPEYAGIILVGRGKARTYKQPKKLNPIGLSELVSLEDLKIVEHVIRQNTVTCRRTRFKIVPKTEKALRIICVYSILRRIAEKGAYGTPLIIPVKGSILIKTPATKYVKITREAMRKLIEETAINTLELVST